MPAALFDRLNDLQAAIEAENWADFDAVLKSWSAEEPENAWVSAGLALAKVLRGDEMPDTEASLQAINGRLAGMAALLAAVRAGNKGEARKRALAELATGNADPSLVEALKWADEAASDVTRYLFATPGLVAGCVMAGGQPVSMTARDSRMSADSLGTKSEAIWELAIKMNQFIDLGDLTGIRVFGEDGGWTLGAAYADDLRLVAGLVDSTSNMDELAARTRLVVAALEGPGNE